MTSTSFAETNVTGKLELRRLKDLILSSDGHAFDTKTGRSYRINPSGQLALLLMQEGQSASEVVSRLAAHFSQHAAVVAASTEAFASQLRRYLP